MISMVRKNDILPLHMAIDPLPDMLDEFSATKITIAKDDPPKPEHLPSGETDGQETSDTSANDFAKQLQEQMAALMGNGEESPEMKREIEAMMQELGAAVDPGSSKDGSLPPKGKSNDPQLPNTEEPFQETIRKTMERMQASGEQATAAAKSEESDDVLAQMLKEMQNGGLEGAGDDEGFNKMLMGMMEQLTNKDILYEPMKELHDKFPGWMKKNKDTTAAEDLKRYETQQGLVKEIVGRFEQKGYSDSKAEDREFIVERMQQVSSLDLLLMLNYS